MRILVTNDDGYTSQGIRTLALMLREYGDVTAVAPKGPQSGMSLAVNLGSRSLAYRRIGNEDGFELSYLDATPASCVKYALNFSDSFPDVVVSGINHGSNATMGALYSGTLGACQEAAINGLTGIGVSIDTHSEHPDFSAVEALFPAIFRKLVSASEGKPFGTYYNVNFPELPPEKIKGVRLTHMGIGRWIREFKLVEECNAEGETVYAMTGEYLDSGMNPPDADHHLMSQGYVTVTAHSILNTDTDELRRLSGLGIERNLL